MSYEIDEYPDVFDGYDPPVELPRKPILASSQVDAKNQMDYNRIINSMAWLSVSEITMKSLRPSPVFWQSWNKRKQWMKNQGFTVSKQNKKWVVYADNAA